MNNYAQGTIEYLVIIGIVVVISLVVTGLVMQQMGSASNVSSTASEIKLKTGVSGISIIESVAGVDENGLLVLKNMGSETIVVNKIVVDGVDHNFSDSVVMGSQLGFKLSDIVVCDETKKVYSVKVYFTSFSGLEKSADFENITIDCTNTVNSSGNFVEETITGGGVTSYIVSFDSQRADTNANPTSILVELPNTTVDSLPTDPAREGFTFGGWYTETNGSGTQFLANTPVSNSQTVYAKWVANEGTFVVTFDSQNADINSNPTYRVIIDPYNDLESMPIDPIKSGYTFYGWFPQTNGRGAEIGPYTPLSIQDTTLYAYWAIAGAHLFTASGANLNMAGDYELTDNQNDRLAYVRTIGGAYLWWSEPIQSYVATPTSPGYDGDGSYCCGGSDSPEGHYVGWGIYEGEGEFDVAENN